MWLDLNGAALPDVGQQLNTSACYAAMTYGACYRTSIIAVTVLNCLEFFVYFLNPTPAGAFSSYCAIDEN